MRSAFDVEQAYGEALHGGNNGRSSRTEQTLMASHDQFLIVRRFSRLRMRLLLLTQDKIAQLERKLDQIDCSEKSPLFLGSSRLDKNGERQAVLLQVREDLGAYDDLVERTSRISLYQKPQPWHVQSLKNWLAGNSPINRYETEFLEYNAELASLGRTNDKVVSWLEYLLSRLPRRLRESNVSRDPRVHILPRAASDAAIRTVIAPLVALVLLVPAIICKTMTGSNARLITIVISTIIFSMLLSLLTWSKTADLAIAGATYTAVLIVFIST